MIFLCLGNVLLNTTWKCTFEPSFALTFCEKCAILFQEKPRSFSLIRDWKPLAKQGEIPFFRHHFWLCFQVDRNRSTGVDLLRPKGKRESGSFPFFLLSVMTMRTCFELGGACRFERINIKLDTIGSDAQSAARVFDRFRTLSLRPKIP